MGSIFQRFAKLLRPREGWVPLLLTLVALFSPAIAFAESSQATSVATCLLLTSAAAFIGLRLARARTGATRATIVGGLSGFALTITAVGSLMPPATLLWHDGRAWAASWRLLRQGIVVKAGPGSVAIGYTWHQLQDIASRFWWWARTAAQGGVSQDSAGVLLLGLMAIWCCSLFAVWQIFQRRSPLIGLMPCGTLMATIAFFRDGIALFYLFAFLFCLWWLVALGHLWLRRDRWEHQSIDYPGGLGFELGLNLAPPLALILALSLVFPVIYPAKIRDAVWRTLSEPWARLEEPLERFFGPFAGGYPGAGQTDGSLPRSHLLGSGPELEEIIVFLVTTSDPPPIPPLPDQTEKSGQVLAQRYWRSTTYDTYTGRGWENGPLEEQTVAPDRNLVSIFGAENELMQRFQLVSGGDETLYAVNQPVRVDHTIQSWWRAPGDMVRMVSNAQSYSVISHPPEPGIDELRLAPEAPSAGPEERFLALPENVPERVRDLAIEVTGRARGRYEQAEALEAFLRTYTYTVDLPTPPANRDLVDYFLFDQQAGYCDYFASSMVVMARALGIPSRLAVGYAQGTYDHEADHWVVTEKDAHSWVEIYFETFGWLEFEPTAGLPALSRQHDASDSPIVPPVPARDPGTIVFPWALLLLVAAIGVLACTVLWLRRPQRHAIDSANALVRERYGRLIRWGTQLGRPMRDGLTPLEHGNSLTEHISEIGSGARWRQTQQASVEAPIQIEQLTRKYVRAQYSPHGLSERDSQSVRLLWPQLRRRLWWLWLGRRTRPTRDDKP